MKLRILGDTLRVRLAQGEVAQLVEQGRVEQTIHFGPGPQQAMRYAVAAAPRGAAITATLDGQSIEVAIGADTIERWASGTEVSLHAEQPLDDARALSILVEKDFKCLVPREGEQDSDGFANPQAR